MRKINEADESIVRIKVRAGVNKLADMLEPTLGPNGRSAIVVRSAGEPLLVDDGRRVAENIKFDDPIEQAVARNCYSITRKTDEKVGDGTTTSICLARAIFNDVSNERIPEGAGAIFDLSAIDSELKTAKEEVIEKLRKMAKPVKSEQELINVAKVSVGEKELGETIGKMYWQLGKDGHISMEFNLLSEKIESEVVPGYRFSGGYAAPWMITDKLRNILEGTDYDVLISHQKITEFDSIRDLINILQNNGRPRLVIIAPSFGPQVLTEAYKMITRKVSPFACVCIRAPGRNEEAYKDMAIFTGSKFFSKNDDLKKAVREDLGYIEKINATDDTTILTGGRGKIEDVKQRAKEVEAEAKLQKLPQFKQDRYERLSALSGGVGLIKIGMPTDEERNWYKHKIEDAKYATKHAFREGIVQGGGMAFKKIADGLPEDNILKRALLAPYNRLNSSMGGKMVVGKDIFDPVAVEIAALENAVSAVSKLLRVGVAIAFKPTPELDEVFKNVLAGSQVEEDYDENHDDL